MVTTLQVYGVDSYPFVHLANRLCMPYPKLMAVVESLRKPPGKRDPYNVPGVSMREIEAIIGVYAGELRRQEETQCSRA